MQDFLGRELQLGDFVIFKNPGYSDLTLGKVVKITPKMVRLEYKSRYGEKDSTVINSGDTVRVDEKELTVYFLKHGYNTKKS